MDHAADHAQVLVPPPLVFLGYLLGALLLNWAVPFPYHGWAPHEPPGEPPSWLAWRSEVRLSPP